MITDNNYQLASQGRSSLDVTSNVSDIAHAISTLNINQQQSAEINVYLSTKEYVKIDRLTFGAVDSEYCLFGELDQILGGDGLGIFNIQFFVTSIVEERLIIDILQRHGNKINSISLILFKYQGMLSDKVGLLEEKVAKIEIHMLEKLESLSLMIPKLTGLTHLINCKENLDYSQLSNLRCLSLQYVDDIATIPLFIESLTIDSCGMQLEGVPTGLKYLKVYNCETPYDILLNLIKSNSQLEELVLINDTDEFSVSCDEFSELVTEISRLPKLSNLELGQPFDLKLLETCPLQSLKIFGCKNFNANLSVKELTITNLNITLPTELFVDSNIQKLNLKDVFIEGNGKLKFPHSLTSLLIDTLCIDDGCCYYEAEEFTFDASEFEFPSTLKHLTLSRFYANKLPIIPELIEHLDLSHNRLSFICLDDLEKLKFLNLSDNRLSKLNVSSSVLEETDISDNKLTELCLSPDLRRMKDSGGTGSFNSLQNFSCFKKLEHLDVGYFDTNPDFTDFPNTLDTVYIQTNKLNNFHFHSESMKKLELNVALFQGFSLDTIKIPNNIASLSICMNGCLNGPLYPNLFSRLETTFLNKLTLHGGLLTTETNPLLLPSSIRYLNISGFRTDEIHLKFPPNCTTNLRQLYIEHCYGDGGISRYSFESIGHGIENTYHDNLEIISATAPPSFSLEVNEKLKQAMLSSFDLSTFHVDNNVLQTVFQKSTCPMKLLEIIDIDEFLPKWVLINPNHDSHK
jgi:hypothetical protein